MRTLDCDVAIIGTGTAGLAAHEASSAAGARTLLIESGPYGTTCARVGCMPSKLLIAAGKARHAALGVAPFGLRGPTDVPVDGTAVMERVRRLRDDFVGSVLDSVADIPDANKIRGKARFMDATTLAVGDDLRIEARSIVIATGSRPMVPEPLEDLGDLVLTNETVFELPDLPRSLAVVGAGPLGLELALAFRRLGVAVTVFDTGRTINNLSDPAACDVFRNAIEEEIELVLEAELEGRRVGDEAELSWTTKSGGSGKRRFARVLASAGRPPNVDGLDLERTGIALDERGSPAFDPATMRCGDSSIFIAGDASHEWPVLHEATDQGRIAGANAARFPDVAPVPRMVKFAIAFTDPGTATVGPPFPEVENDVEIGEADLSRSGRARTEDRAVGLIRIYGRKSDRKLLGGTIVGPDAEHLGHLLAWLVQLGITADDALALPFYHPTLAESLRKALRDLCGKQGVRPEMRPHSREYGSGS